MMKTLIKLAACSMTMLAWSASDVAAKCTARDKFTLEIKNQLQSGETGVQLLDENGVALGCWLPTNKALGEFCSGANGSAQKYELTVLNSCQKPIKAVVYVTPTYFFPFYSQIIFTGDKDCLDALEDEGRAEKLNQGQTLKVSCKTKKYMKDASSFLVYTAHYSVDVSEVDGIKTGNGLYDPRIAVERDGDVSTSVPFLVKVIGWLTVAFGALGAGLHFLRKLKAGKS